MPGLCSVMPCDSVGARATRAPKRAGWRAVRSAAIAAAVGLSACGSASPLPAVLQFDGLDASAVVRIDGEPIAAQARSGGAVRVVPGHLRIVVEQPGFLPAYVEVRARPNGVYVVAPVMWPCFEELDPGCVR